MPGTVATSAATPSVAERVDQRREGAVDVGVAEGDEGDLLSVARATGAVAAAAARCDAARAAPPPSPSGLMSNARRSTARPGRAVRTMVSARPGSSGAVVGATTRSAASRTRRRAA